MILQPSQAKRFMKLIDLLTLYVNERTNTVNPRILGPGPGMLDSKSQAFVMKALWDDLSLIDDFVNENPNRLSRTDLKEIASWRNGITGYHAVARTEDGQVVFLTGGYVFDVRGITRELDTILGKIPCFVETMIIPFDGRITYTVGLMVQDIHIGPNIHQSIDEEIREAIRNGKHVTSGRNFAEVAAIIEREREEQELEDLQREAENALAAAVPMEGTHRGALAGLDQEERDRILEERAREKLEPGEELWIDNPRSLLLKQASKRPPKFTCNELLGMINKKDLVSMADDLDIEGAANMLKADLVSAISTGLRGDPSLLHDTAAMIGAEFIDMFESIIAAGGRLTIPEISVTFDTTMPPYPPILFLFYREGSFTYVIPEELVDGLKALDWEELRRDAQLRNNVWKLAVAATDLRGVVPMTEFIEDCRSHFPEIQNEEDIVRLTVTAAVARPAFVVLSNKEEMVLLEFDVADAYLDELQDEVRMQELTLMFGPIDGVVLDILDMQDGKEPRPVDDDMLNRALPLFWREEMPAVVALRDWLDENVPDDCDDYQFADDVIRAFLDRVRWGIAGADTISEYLEILDDEGLALDEAHLQVFLDLLMKFMNSQPNWQNNGWSPDELASKKRSRNARAALRGN